MSRVKNRHICFISNINPYTTNGGAEIQTKYWIDKFRQAGFKVSVISENRSRDIQTPIQIHFIKKRFIFNIIPCIHLLLILFIIRPDICYQRLRNEFTAVVGLYCALTGTKFLWWCSNDNEINHYYRFNFRGTIHSPKFLLIYIDNFITDIISYFAIKTANYVVVQNNTQNVCAQAIGVRTVKRIRNSINTSQIRTTDGTVKKRRIIWVGNCKKVKRPIRFLELIKKINREDIEFRLIGRLASYRKFILAFQQSTRYAFTTTGPISHDQAIQELAEARILINTSSSEGFSNTFIEAWTVGTYVITLGVNPDKLLDGTLGEAYQDVADIAKRVNDIIDNEIFFQKRAVAMSNFVRHAFHIDENFKALRQFINE